jgi:hypothetical protein
VVLPAPEGPTRAVVDRAGRSKLDVVEDFGGPPVRSAVGEGDRFEAESVLEDERLPVGGRWEPGQPTVFFGTFDGLIALVSDPCELLEGGQGLGQGLDLGLGRSDLGNQAGEDEGQHQQFGEREGEVDEGHVDQDGQHHRRQGDLDGGGEWPRPWRTRSGSVGLA